MTKQEEFDILIIGAGCIGSSIFFEMSCSKDLGQNRKIGIFDLGRNTTSATSASGGLIRLFHENSKHIQLAHENLMALRSLDSVKNYFKSSGSLYFFKKNRESDYLHHFQWFEKNNYPFMIYDKPRLAQELPQFYIESQELAVFEPDGGVLDVKSFYDHLIKQSLVNKNFLFFNDSVLSLSKINHFYFLKTKNKIFKTKKLILCTGSQSHAFLTPLGIKMPLVTKELSYFSYEDTSFPNSPHYFDRESLEFGRPQKEMSFNSSLSPKRIKTIMPIKNVKKILRKDMYAPHREGLIGEIPGYEGLYIATGWGGTAVKFSLSIGKQMTQLLENKNKTSSSFRGLQ